MSCQECGLGDWLLAGRPEPVGRMGWPGPCWRFSQLLRPAGLEWAEHGKLGWRGQMMPAAGDVPRLPLVCGIYLGCLQLSVLLIYFFAETVGGENISDDLFE